MDYGKVNWVKVIAQAGVFVLMLGGMLYAFCLIVSTL